MLLYEIDLGEGEDEDETDNKNDAQPHPEFCLLENETVNLTKQCITKKIPHHIVAYYLLLTS